MVVEPSPKRESERPTTLLIFPPQWTPHHPHFSLTSLAGHLRSRGYPVVLRDLNVEYFHHLLHPKQLDVLWRKAQLAAQFYGVEMVLTGMLGETDLRGYLAAERATYLQKFIPDNFERWQKTTEMMIDATRIMRDPTRFYDPLQLVGAMLVIDNALEFASLPHHPIRMHFNNLELPFHSYNFNEMEQFTRNRDDNMFLPFFERAVPELLDVGADIIGISINSFSQVFPGLTLARMIREQKPADCILNIGGNFFGRLKEVLLQRPEFFEMFADTMILGEGERYLLELVQAVETGRPFEQVPSLIYYREGKVNFTYEMPPEPLESVGFQDFDGLPLELYFSPEIVACIHATKGCYWRKCTFCDSDFGVTSDKKSLDRLIEEIRHLRQRFGIRHFEFIDECIPPGYMREMAQRFIDEKLDIHWFANARTETVFTYEFCDLLHRSGLTMLLWGVESGSPRVMEMINKGVEVEKRIDILRDSSRAGIWNFAYIFFGFPTETREEAMSTIKLIVGNTDVINSYGRSVFTLGKHSKLRDKAFEYGILDIIEDDQEFSTNLFYHTANGLNSEERTEMLNLCTKMSAEAYGGDPLWMYLRYRENLHLFLARHGLDYVRKYNLSEVEETPRGFEIEAVW